jgi:hypothetical protein
MDNEIIIVSGLPRSGTSLMMQMLQNGGIEVVTDHLRTADTDNPRGYFELERVKKIRHDASWLPDTRGKSFKMVSQLLYDLPATERYRILFMERDLDEVLISQEKMLERLGHPAVPRDQMRRSFLLHLDKLHAWLRQQRHMAVFLVRYNELLEKPDQQARRISEFLEARADAEKMALSVDPSLYRNRRMNGVIAPQ